MHGQLQTMPILSDIVNMLAVDADKFFDQLAEKNEIYLENEPHAQRTKIVTVPLLSKLVFYDHLRDY